MANPTSRQTLIDYCLRQLGHPVIEINVDDDQLEDRVDEAIQFYREFHYDSVELVYLKQEFINTTFVIGGVNASNFSVGDIITGQSSGAKTTVLSIDSANTFTTTSTSGTFSSGETVTGSSSGTSSTFSSITLGNIDNKYFELNDNITGVVRVIPFTSRTRGIDLFDVRYQILLNDIYSVQSTDIIYYNQVKTQLNLLNDLLVGEKPIRFNRHQNRLHVDMDWNAEASAGEFVVVECYRILDPDTFTDVYNDYFLKRYLTSLIKRQWGNNLKKFEGIQLPGGVTLNGQIIYQEAIQELQEIRQEAESTYQLPVDFFLD